MHVEASDTNLIDFTFQFERRSFESQDAETNIWTSSSKHILPSQPPPSLFHSAALSVHPLAAACAPKSW